MPSLYETLDQRRRPEDVARMIQEAPGDALSPEESRILERAAAGSIKRSLMRFT